MLSLESHPMTQWNIAFVKEQGVNFAVAQVKDHVLANNNQAEELTIALGFKLGQPVVLLGARQRHLYGRKDIVQFLRNVQPSRLPWRLVDIAA